MLAKCLAPNLARSECPVLAMGMMVVMATVKSPLTQIGLGRGEEVHAALGPRREVWRLDTQS